LRGKNPFEDPGVDGRIILRWIIMKWEGAQDRDRRRALVKVAMNLHFHKTRGIS